MSRTRPAPPQRMFTIIELDDLGVPHGGRALHHEIIDDTDPGYSTLACVFQLPDTDEYYRFYYRQYNRRGPVDAGWDDAYPDGNVLCARVTRTVMLTPQWVGIRQQHDAVLTWSGAAPIRADDGVTVPLLHDGQPICTLHIPDKVAAALVRALGGIPGEAAPDGLVGVAAASAAVGVSPSALSKMRTREQVPAHHVDGQWMYDVREVRAALARHIAERAARRAGTQLTLDG